MASFCPYCKTEDCYNTGFTIECINKKCQFFSASHREYVLQSKPPIPEQELVFPEEQEFEEIKYYGYGHWSGYKP